MEDKRQEELDLLSVSKSLKSGILKLLNAISWLFDFSIKKILPLSLFIIITIGISLGFYFSEKPYYKSELSISHIRLDNDYCAKMINNLNVLLNEQRENSDLAENLGIDKKIAKEVKYIFYKPTNVNLVKQYSDSMLVLLPFKVEVEIYNNEILPELQKGIMNYLESNEYATKLKTISSQSLIQVEQRIKEEIKQIDSLKMIVNNAIVPRSNGTGIILGEPIDPVSVYNRSMQSYEKLMAINKSIELNNSFQVMVGFNKNYKLAGHGILWYVAIGIITGYIIGLLFLLRKNLKQTN